MLRVLFGFAVGVYVTQNYNIPDVLDVVSLIQKALVAYEKDPLSKRK